MMKNVIIPIQNWLLSQGRCVGCSMPLKDIKHAKYKKAEKVTCKCGRVYIKEKDSYRRALLSEV